MGSAAGAFVRADAERYLKLIAGDCASLRDGQWAGIDELVNRTGRVVMIQATGWGKSAVYFIAAKLLRESGRGVSVIISPLLALMRNQIKAAERAGIIARTLNSSNFEEWESVYSEIKAGKVDVLLISPERVNSIGFKEEVFSQLQSQVGMLVVDEAHCVSDWGHDFRPDYMRIKALIADLGSEVAVLATTATANERVMRDIEDQIGFEGQVLTLRGSLDRESLRLSVLEFADDLQSLSFIGGYVKGASSSGVVYCLTVAACQKVSGYLRSVGVEAEAYYGGLESEVRVGVEEDLLSNKLKCVVATSALGMGFDKADIGFVIHFGAPSSPVAYYQMIGRAGRGMERAEVILIPGEADRAVWEWFESVGVPSEEVMRDVFNSLDSQVVSSTVKIEGLVNLSRGRIESCLKILDVLGCARRVKGGWLKGGAVFSYDTEKYAAVRLAQKAEKDAMELYIKLKTCRLSFLRERLGEGRVLDCGRCDVCLGGVGDLSGYKMGEVTGYVDGGSFFVEIARKKMMPNGMGGKIDEAAGFRSGRALVRLSDIGLAKQVRADLESGSVSDFVFERCLEVLKSWKFEGGLDLIVTMPSSRRGGLISDLAFRLGQRSGLEVRNCLEFCESGVFQESVYNSNFKLKNAKARVKARESADATGRRVLLIDDVVDTGWSLFAASEVLLSMGAVSIFGFALGSLS